MSVREIRFGLTAQDNSRAVFDSFNARLDELANSSSRRLRESMSSLTVSGREAQTAAVRVRDVIAVEFHKLATSKEMKLAVEISKEAWAESMNWVKGRIDRVRFKVGASVEFAKEKADDALRSMLSSFVQFARSHGGKIPIDFGTVDAPLRTLKRFLADSAKQELKIGIDIARDKWETLSRQLINKLPALGAKLGIKIPVDIGISQHPVRELGNFIVGSARGWGQSIRQSLDTSMAAGVATVQKHWVPIRNFPPVRFAINVTSNVGRFLGDLKPLLKPITLTAVNGVGNVVRAAMGTLGPFTNLAKSGVKVLLHASAAGITNAASVGMGAIKSLASGGMSMLASLAAAAGSVVLGLGAIAAVAAPIALVSWAAGSVDATAKLSDRLGIATEKLVALQYQAKMNASSAEGLELGLKKMVQTVGEAANGNEQASTAFRHLGLDMKALADMSPDQQFAAIADKIAAIKNPTERASAAYGVFGKQSQELMVMLMQGSEGMRASQVEAEKLGIVFNRVDAAKVELANDAMTRIRLAIEGAAQTLAIQFAPFVDAAASKLLSLGTSGEGVGTMIVNAFEWVLTTIAKGADTVSLFEEGWYNVKFAIGTVGQIANWVSTKMAEGIVWGVNKIADALNVVIEKSNQIIGTDFSKIGHIEVNKDAVEKDKKYFDDMVNAANAGAKKAHNAWANGDSQKAVQEFFKGIRDKSQQTAEEMAKRGKDANSGGFNNMEGLDAAAAKAEENRKKADEIIRSMNDQAHQLGMTEAQKKIEQLQAAGAGADVIEQAKQLQAQIDAFDVKQKLQAKANSLIESIKTPLDKYNDQIKQIGEMVSAGALSPDQMIKASEKAKKDLQAATQKDGGRIELKLVDSVSGRFATGLAQAAQERAQAFNPMLEAQKFGNDTLSHINEGIWQLANSPSVKQQASGSLLSDMWKSLIGTGGASPMKNIPESSMDPLNTGRNGARQPADTKAQTVTADNTSRTNELLETVVNLLAGGKRRTAFTG